MQVVIRDLPGVLRAGERADSRLAADGDDDRVKRLALGIFRRDGRVQPDFYALGAALALDGTALPYAETAQTLTAAGSDRIALTAIVTPTAGQILTVRNNTGNSVTYSNSTLTIVKLA